MRILPCRGKTMDDTLLVRVKKIAAACRQNTSYKKPILVFYVYFICQLCSKKHMNCPLCHSLSFYNAVLNYSRLFYQVLFQKSTHISYQLQHHLIIVELITYLIGHTTGSVLTPAPAVIPILHQSAIYILIRSRLIIRAVIKSIICPC